MGVPDFLAKVLESAGRDVDLRDYKDGIPVGRLFDEGCHPEGNKNNNKKRKRHCDDSVRGDKGQHRSSSSSSRRRRRPLRIGIDVYSWIFKAAHGFGDMLGDERHLTNYGRAALLEEEQKKQQQQLQQHPVDPGASQKSIVTDYVHACTRYVMTRLQNLQETSQASILVVLDGKSPPIKAKEVAKRRYQTQQQQQERDGPVYIHYYNFDVGEDGDDADNDERDHDDDYDNRQTAANDRRTKAFRRAGPGSHISKIVAHLLEALKATKIPFLVAPYEADGQLAYLLRQNLIDLVITEDSDLIAHGGTSLLYKSVANISSGIPAGRLLQFQDLGAGLEGINNQSRSSLQLMDFTPVMVAVMFVLLGCDYCERKLKGIGIITAQKIVRMAFLERRPKRIGSPQGRAPHDALSIVWHEAYNRCSEKSTLTAEFRSEFEESFLEALFTYRHPIVYDPIVGDCLVAKEYATLGDPELLENRKYAALCTDLTRVYNIIGDLPSGAHDATAIAEGNDTTWRNSTKSVAGMTTITDPEEATAPVGPHEGRTEQLANGGVPVDGVNETITGNNIDDKDSTEHLARVENHRGTKNGMEAGQMSPSQLDPTSETTMKRVREVDFEDKSDVEETDNMQNLDAKTSKTDARRHKSFARRLFQFVSSPSWRRS